MSSSAALLETELLLGSDGLPDVGGGRGLKQRLVDGSVIVSDVYIATGVMHAVDIEQRGSYSAAQAQSTWLPATGNRERPDDGD